MSIVHSINGSAIDEASNSGEKPSMIELFNRCFICQKYIGKMIGIYIYKNMAFCSNDCRNKEMEKYRELEEKPKNQLKMKRIKRSRKNSTPMRAVIYFRDGSSSSSNQRRSNH